MSTTDTPETDSFDADPANLNRNDINTYHRALVHARRLERERDEARNALAQIRNHAIAIHDLRWGWDGDCGASRIAEDIQEICDTITPPAPPQSQA